MPVRSLHRGYDPVYIEIISVAKERAKEGRAKDEDHWIYGGMYDRQ